MLLCSTQNTQSSTRIFAYSLSFDEKIFCARFFLLLFKTASNEMNFLFFASHHFRVMPACKCFVKCVLVCWPPPSSSSTSTFHRIHLLSNCISISFHSASHNFCKSEKETRNCWQIFGFCVCIVHFISIER